MILSFLSKIFGSANDRFIKSANKDVIKINALEPKMQAMTDEELAHQTQVFKERLAKGETVDHLMVEAFAVAREASRRVFAKRHFDVQLIGGMVLHKGMLAEMKTGEGKTLMAALPAYLNALTGRGVHIVTVNDYLARRDSEEMGQLYNFLGLSVGCIVHGLTDSQRRQAYGSDITYGTNHEFGFDYLRDNMKFSREDMVQRPFYHAIVDEVDSILIDEARTPLIISGAAEDSSHLYMAVNELIPHLEPQDYEKDEKQRSIALTDSGVEKLEDLLRQSGLLTTQSLYDVQNISLVHHVNQALKAHKMFAKDVDYIVKNKKVVIIDEFTGRMMEGRRYSEGLHQALEAKENVPIEQENQTLASISYQNLFRLYEKLSGMTGTAFTEAEEFEQIYKLKTVVIPTNVPVARIDHEDEVYLTSHEKHKAVLKQIKECHERKQPVLVVTPSIEKSDYLSSLLKDNNLPHQVLNARYHEQEAMIIAEAGAPGAITIATNMAGRGTDIKLGGNYESRMAIALKDQPEDQHEAITQKVKENYEQDRLKTLEAGGLFVVGTERNESRRVDNQARGRSGRQGDPGASKFFVSLEDDLMRIFGSDRLDSMLRRLGVEEGEAISHRWITNALERAQRKVEARNFDMRKHLLRYDDVMNEQRKIIYQQRLEFMTMADVQPVIEDMRYELIEDIVARCINEQQMVEQWDTQSLHMHCLQLFGLDLPIQEWVKETGISIDVITQRIIDAANAHFKQREEVYGAESMRQAEKNILLGALDQAWKDHLYVLDHLRQGINLRAYAQSNPINEYKREAFNLFETMLQRVRSEVTALLMHFSLDDSENSKEEILEGILPKDLELDDDFDFSGLSESDKETFNKLFESFIESYGENTEENSEQAKQLEEFFSNLSLADLDAAAKASEGEDLEERHTLKTKDYHHDADLPRNSPCPCGSGKKFKHCHGALDGALPTEE